MIPAGPSWDLEMVVTWGDCDAAGISYYARSFDWFTNGRFGLLAAYGFPYMETFHAAGISMVCLTADCQYKRMLRPEESIVLQTALTVFTRSRVAFAYRIYKINGELAAEGATTHAYIGGNGKPVNLERKYPNLWERLTKQWSPTDQRARMPADGRDGMHE
ncbi:thioesterase family protein [Paenibacillus sp. R14(2021)]|uniref:acyl-CoA thioesterase n=1 Tax=Paenibacillus sp. R14(2021) TaxID=2859228 RepID=UPI001C614FBA|nr:acyl-CoA thioesterase [Paenibacillus sp. R14(2021)]